MKKTLSVGMIAVLMLFSVGVRFESRIAAQEQDNAESAVTSDSDTTGIEETQEDELVLYVQEGCSHCAKVEAFIENHKLGDEIVVRDTVQDSAASTDFTEFLDEQGVPLEERGVPMLVYGDSDWVSGDTPIIDYLSERFAIEEDGNEYSASDYAILGVAVVVIVGVVGYAIVNTGNARKNQ